MDRYTIPIEEVAALIHEFGEDAIAASKDSTIKFFIEKCVNDELFRRAMLKDINPDSMREVLEILEFRSEMRAEHLNSEIEVMRILLESKIDSAKLSVLRGMHSGDRVAKLLTGLVERARKVCGPETWVCGDCGRKLKDNLPSRLEAGTPFCVDCETLMFPEDSAQNLFETEEWEAAEAMVLRINEIKASKDAKKKAKKKAKKGEE